MHVGPATIWGDATRLGFGPASAIVGIALLEHLFHTLGWRVCFEPGRRPATLHLLCAYLAGGAISLVTPTATLGGEVVRGSLLPRRVSAAEAVASVTTDRLAFTLVDSLLGLGGLVVLLVHGPFTGWARIGLLAAAAAFASGVGTFFVLQRSGRLAGFLGRHPLVRKLGGDLVADRVARGTSDVDERLASFHADRRASFATSMLLHALGTSIGGLQLILFLVFLGAPFTAGQAAEAFLVAIAFDLFSFFVPARLGAYEGSRVVAMSVAGLDPHLGLLFSLVLRVEQIAWAAIGLVLYPSLLSRRRTAGAAVES
jgi:uncharacterized protein (TIRG00374 family)